jgi:hypothetical protein
MKLQTVLAAMLFAAVSAGAYAADADKAAPAADNKAEQPAKAKPHSHVEEKTGVPQKAPAPAEKKLKADKDKSKHYHPRDMK